MADVPKPSRTWVRLLIIVVVVVLVTFALLILTDSGGLFDYDTF